MTKQAIQRYFHDLSEGDVDLLGYRAPRLWSPFGGISWDELLKSDRVLIVSEAGSGKTYECQSQQKLHWDQGRPSFYLDLSTLATTAVEEMLSVDEGNRLAQWLRGSEETAFFFLDSIDELNLTAGKLDQALKRLGRAVEGKLAQIKVVITTRPVPIDRELIERYLPVPPPVVARPTGEDFANIVLEQHPKKAKESEIKIWRQVGLLPLSRDQMSIFAANEGVNDTEAFLTEVYNKNAEELATRPQDLMELCADWQNNHRIGSYFQQIQAAVATKSKQRTDRNERASLSLDKALDGASRLALAAVLSKRFTIKYGAPAGSDGASVPAFEPSTLLTGWTSDEIATLLERPLFGFASYGRVRFHHRSMMEFLAAQRLDAMIKGGVPIARIKRLLFTTTIQGLRIIRPSLRPVVGWLSMWSTSIFNDVAALDPAVLLDHGDPQSLSPGQKQRALEAYVSRYGDGGKRGREVPKIQVKRFVSADLADYVSASLKQIENPEVRELLLQLIAAGKLVTCLDVVHEIAMDPQREIYERFLAVDALVELADPRLPALTKGLHTPSAIWPDKLARRVAVALFPEHLSPTMMIDIIKRTHEEERSVGEINYRLAHKIEEAAVPVGTLTECLDLFTNEILLTVRHNTEAGPDFVVSKPELVPVLIAICCRLLAHRETTRPWARASMIAICCGSSRRSGKDGISDLADAFEALRSEDREALFWERDHFLTAVLQPRDLWHRAYNSYRYGGLRLSDKKDAPWLEAELGEKARLLEEREVLLHTILKLTDRAVGLTERDLHRLKALVADAPALSDIIERELQPPARSAEFERLEREHQEYVRKEAEQKAAAHESWVRFWREVIEKPEEAFAEGKAESTAWHLWRAMESYGDESRASGWNRRFIELQFDKATADRLRESLLPFWRKHKPTLQSERTAAERNTYPTVWQFGLAAITAEAENSHWTEALSKNDAELACRYVPLNLNGFPAWLSDLASRFQGAVERILGNELRLAFEAFPNEHIMLLQDASYAVEGVAKIFTPTALTWLLEVTADAKAAFPATIRQNVTYATSLIFKAGSPTEKGRLREAAEKYLGLPHSEAQSEILLPILMQRDPALGVARLDAELQNEEISQYGKGVLWIGRLFGRDFNGTTIDVSDKGFTPELLLRLNRLAYKHVLPSQDLVHESSYSPDLRDHAEQGRNALLGALLERSGPEAYAAKVAMANDPLFAHFRDRAIYLADQKSAQEADSVGFTEQECAVADREGEGVPRTPDDMLDLMVGRLEDIDDLLLQEESPRSVWAKIDQEFELRRELARRLRDTARDLYNVDQEAVTADEKETDIRLLATSGVQRGTIELKLGEKDRSANVLRSALRDQLLGQYMAAAEARAGCLLISIAEDKKWRHPDTGKMMEFPALIAFLNEEADKISRSLNGSVKLFVKGLDLRPRL